MKPISFLNNYFRFLVVPTVSLLLFLTYWAINSDENTQFYFISVGIKGIVIDFCNILLFTFIVSEAILFISKWIDTIITWEKSPFLRIIVQFLIEIPVVYLILKFSELGLFWSSPTTALDKRQNMVMGIIFSIVVTLVVIADYFFKQMQQSIAESEKLKNAYLQAQLNALKIQLDPHFLFNNFSTLQSLIELNGLLASEFLSNLSIVYRYLTLHRMENLVTVQKEMDFVNAYLFLYEIRFGNNFKVEVKIPHAIQNKLIPPVTLQILIENAIKHNVISSEFPLKMQIVCDNDNILVINNLQPKTSDAASLKSGLSNIISRYELIGNKKPEIIRTETHFTVIIPLLENLND